MANKKTEYHIYSHTNPTIQTVGEFVGESDSIGIGFSIVYLLNYQDENNNFNIDKLINLYTPYELKKYKSLIDEIKNKKPSQTKNNTETIKQNKTVTVPIEKQNVIKVDSYYVPKNIVQLQKILRTGNSTVIPLIDPKDPRDRRNVPYLRLLYNDSIKFLFAKFLYRISIETDYEVEITSSYRSLKEEESLAKTNELSIVGFNYHLAKLAVDINLIHSTTNAKINSKSTKLQWETTGVPKIASELGITWGGTFTKVDVVHFDARDFFQINKEAFVTAVDNRIIRSEEDAVEVQREEEVDNNSKYLDLPIKIGTVLALPLKDIDRAVLITETNQAVNSINFESFLAKELIQLLSDKGFKRTFVPKTQSFNGTVQEIYPYISVWVWSRALSISNINAKDDISQYEHQIINITPYISALNTAVTDNGGNFSFDLAPIIADLRDQGGNKGKGWNISKNTQIVSKVEDGDYVNQGHIHYIENDELKRNRMYFEKILQYNDIVFIRFERLQLEDDRGDLDKLQTISLNELPNQIFDMIGLIDDVSSTSQYANADVSIKVSGRDLIKLLIEDGIYFYPTEATADGIFANTGASNSRLGRFGARGEYESRFQSANKTIDRSLKFIMNSLGTIEICPSNLFSGYANASLTKGSSQIVDKRSRAFPLESAQSKTDLKQQQDNNDNKGRILENIERLRKINNITLGSKVQVFNIIKTFLSIRIQNNQITVENQKILSWEEVDNNITYFSRLPINLINTLFLPDRTWLDQKDRDISNRLEFASIVDQLEVIYQKTNKDKLNDILLPLKLFKNLKYNTTKDINKDTYYISKIPFQDLVTELQSYLIEDPEFFDSTNIDSLQEDYVTIKAQGNSIIAGILAKLFDNLTDSEQSIFNDIYNLIITETSTLDKNNTPTTPPVLAGIWQIIKLVIDDSVSNRRLTDSSIGNENGSLLNAFRKICQDPFCEFYTDTYGSQFYFIVRKKPFDQQSIISMLDGRVTHEVENYIDSSQTSETESDNLGSTTTSTVKIPIIQDLIINIEETDIITDSLKYCTEAYSWYKLQLANLTQGSASDMAFAYLKAIYFEEYADVFGSKPLDLTTSYIPYSPIIDKNKKLPTAYFIQQGIYDLKYMIESHAHLPFTRMGSITLNGDRRIKKGNFIRLKSTDEIFYVDAVIQDYSITDKTIERSTTIQVSRGMVERFIKGVEFVNSEQQAIVQSESAAESNKIIISYFNICDLPIDTTIFTNAEASYSSFSKASIARWKVNKPVFNFFLKRLQFSKNDKEIFDTNLNLFKK